MDPLVVLRSAVGAKKLPLMRDDKDNDTNDISIAAKLHFDPVPGISEDEFDLDLSVLSRFEVDDPETGAKKELDFKTVYFAFLTKDLGTMAYREQCDSKKVHNLTFVDKTNLLTWLDGASQELTGLKEEKKKEDAKPGVKRKREINPELQEVYEQERSLIDHNTALRGNKLIDFESVARECKFRILEPQRKGKSVRETDNTPKPQQKREPIILISQSASALINRANVKQFLEDGKFSVNSENFMNSPDLQFLERTSPKLGGRMKFLVVDNVSKFKPEYWDRVIAVFVSGQAWQLKHYKWNNPDSLFQHVPGFALVYKHEPVPVALKSWNVEKIGIDSHERFKDREVSEYIWDRLETLALRRGFTVRKK